jgi:CSLREA domain-containing protein
MNSKQKAILLVFLPFVSFLMLTNWLQTVSAIPAQTHHAILDSIITVTTSTDELNTNGQCSLREAITNANNDDQSGSTDCAAGNGSDTISLSNSIYTLTLLGENEDNNQTGDLDISSDIVFQGVTSATTIIQAGTTITNSIDRVFQITISNTVFSVTFDSLTIRHGKSYGILNYSGGNLNIINSAILSNSYEGNGGIYSTEVLNIVDSNLSFNEGPAVQNTGMLYMNNTVVSNNNGGAGAGFSIVVQPLSITVIFLTIQVEASTIEAL